MSSQDAKIMQAASEMMNLPEHLVGLSEFREEDPELFVMFEALLIAVIKNVYYRGKGNKDLLYEAVSRIIDHRQKKFKTNSIWVDFFHITSEGRKLLDSKDL